MRRTGSNTFFGWPIVLAALLLLPSWVQAEERCVLVEYFTWVDCVPCTSTWGVLDTLIQFYSADSLAVIRYFPETSDPYYQPESSSKQGYYSAYFYPWAFFDGPDDVFGSYPAQYAVKIESLLAVPSPLAMSLEVTYDTLSRSGSAVCQITASESVGGTDLYLRSVLIESELLFEGQLHHQVLRDAYPSALGTSFEIIQGETFWDTLDFSLDPTWLPVNCDLVAFVQDHPTKQVYQSVRGPLIGPRDPAVVHDVTIDKAGSSLDLAWSPVYRDKRGYPQAINFYRVYRDTGKYVQSQEAIRLDSTTELLYSDDATGYVGNIEVNCFYYITAVADGRESDPSVIVGEIDHQVLKGK